jgi:hypothetical protein
VTFLGAALASVLAVYQPPSVHGASVALIWAAAALFQALFYSFGRPERGIDRATTGVASAAAIPAALGTDGAGATIALAAHGALFCLLLRREGQLVVALPAVASLAAAAGWSAALLGARSPYDYTPFLTSASAAAGATTAAAVLGSWLLTRQGARAALGIRGGAAMVVGAVGPVLAFLWGNQELAYARSPSVATFAVIAYWAACGVVAITVGRWRSIAAARQVGLGLAILAALKAVTRASDQPAVGLRIGSYLLVGVFLLAVAYWYRAPGGEGVEPGADGDPPRRPRPPRAAGDALPGA